jgi:hypothetical protein
MALDISEVRLGLESVKKGRGEEQWEWQIDDSGMTSIVGFNNQANIKHTTAISTLLVLVHNFLLRLLLIAP